MESYASYLHGYAFIALISVVAVITPIGMLLTAFLLRPSRPNPVKLSTYECGVDMHDDNWIQFKVQYYMFALLFVVFDVETVFLFPWALTYRQLGWYGFTEISVFLAFLVVGLAYAWRKKALEWK